MLIGFIGIISALLQGGYVRRSMAKVGEGVMARNGVFSCAVGLVLLAIVPNLVATNLAIAVKLLQAAAVCLAFTSATVVNSLTAYASLQCDETFDANTGKPDETHPDLAKGKALGGFRSSGQLGRAIGPLLGTSHIVSPPLEYLFLTRHIACASYWTVGPSMTYAVAAVTTFILSSNMRSIASKKVSA